MTRHVEPRESDSLVLAKMLDMMMQNKLEAKGREQEWEDIEERRRKGNGKK